MGTKQHNVNPWGVTVGEARVLDFLIALALCLGLVVFEIADEVFAEEGVAA